MVKEPSEISGKINNVKNMHRFTNNKGIELIKHFEGFASNPYICAGGHLTIGYGHKIQDGEEFGTISLNEAEDILAKDLCCAERAVVKYIDTLLHDNQFAALVSFTFNMGSSSLQRSSLRQKVNYGLNKEAGREFLRWVYAGGKRQQGLVFRRSAERNLFLTEV
jgi:lysozyme